MRTRVAALILSVGIAGPAVTAQPADEAIAPAAPLDELETVLVVGEQPGPGLWKVSRGDNVMWILPSQDPLPTRMVWRTDEVEARLAESQEVLLPPQVEVNPSVGVLDVIRLLPAIPAALKVGKNPREAMLDEVVPPAAYAQWLELRQRYFVKLRKKADEDDIDQWRPSVAVMMLKGMMEAKNQLSRGRVHRFVAEAAARHEVPVHQLPRILRVVKLEKNIRGMLKDAARVPAAEVACFVQELGRLEPDMEMTKARANAWARGDTAKMRELHGGQPRGDECLFTTAFALTSQDSKNAANGRRMLDAFIWHEEQGRVQAERDWVAAAGRALEANRSTFTVLPTADLFRAGGFLDALRAAGYEVEQPR